MPLTKKQISAEIALCEAATPGPLLHARSMYPIVLRQLAEAMERIESHEAERAQFKASIAAAWKGGAGALETMNKIEAEREALESPPPTTKPEPAGYQVGTVTDRDNPGLKRIKSNGQQESYLVLSEAERSKGFVLPVRQSYAHLKCGVVTRMSRDIAETYARDPKFYGGTFCSGCGGHYALIDGNAKRTFAWIGADGQRDGTYVGEAPGETEFRP